MSVYQIVVEDLVKTLVIISTVVMNAVVPKSLVINYPRIITPARTLTNVQKTMLDAHTFALILRAVFFAYVPMDST